MYIPGNFVIHNGKLAAIADVKSPTVLALHYIDSNGETVMRPAEAHEATCPQTGNPRSEVTHEVYVGIMEVRPAMESELPDSRKPVAAAPDDPESSHGRRR